MLLSYHLFLEEFGGNTQTNKNIVGTRYVCPAVNYERICVTAWKTFRLIVLRAVVHEYINTLGMRCY